MNYKQNNLALYISISFLVFPLFIDMTLITQQIISAMSISALLFSFSQVQKSFFKSDSETDILLAINEHTDRTDLLFALYDIRFKNKDKTQFENQSLMDSGAYLLSNMCEFLGVCILILGLIIPFDFLEKPNISNLASTASIALIFLSSWGNDRFYSIRRREVEIQNNLILTMILRESYRFTDSMLLEAKAAQSTTHENK